MAVKNNRVNAPSVKDEVDGEPKQPYNYLERKIQSLVDSRLEYTGRVSGKLYRWNGAGDIKLVDERDIPDLLSKRIGTHLCCGNHPNEGNLVFQELQ